MKEKECSICHDTKVLSEFPIVEVKHDVKFYRPHCKKCDAIIKAAKRKTLDGCIHVGAVDLRYRLKADGIIDTITTKKLRECFINDTTYLTLHAQWVDSDYSKDLRPVFWVRGVAYDWDSLVAMTFVERLNVYYPNKPHGNSQEIRRPTVNIQSRLHHVDTITGVVLGKYVSVVDAVTNGFIRRSSIIASLESHDGEWVNHEVTLDMGKGGFSGIMCRV